MSDEGLHQDFDGCITLYKDFVKQSSADDRQLLGIEASSSNDVGGNKSVAFSPEYRYYDSNDWYKLSKSYKDEVIKTHSRINGGKNASKPGVYPKSGRGSNNGQGKWKSNITMLEKKVTKKEAFFVL